MLKEISIIKVREDAEEAFNQGNFRCTEAIVYSIRKNIDPDMPIEMIAVASAFTVGVGRAKCMCGAVSGAIICLGYFFGRTQPKDPKCEKCLDLAGELQKSFRDNHKGVLCCHVQTKGMDMASGEHKVQCVGFTGEMAAKAAEIIARELELTVID